MNTNRQAKPEQLALFEEAGKQTGQEAGNSTRPPNSTGPGNDNEDNSSPRDQLLTILHRALEQNRDRPVLVTTSVPSQPDPSDPAPEEEENDDEELPLMGLALLEMASQLAEDPDGRVFVLDGNNCFSPYVLSRSAVRLGLAPHRFLERVEICRAFTCHQMWTLICEELPAQLASRRSSQVQAVFVLDLLASFYDSDVDREEALYLFKCCRDRIRDLAKNNTPSLILIEHPPPDEANGRSDFQQRLATVCPDRLRL